MIFVLMGAPGAGKGTQASLLAERSQDKLFKVSTGDCLRKHVKDGTVLGEKIKDIMSSGQLVSDEILLELVETELNRHPDADIILDGYPRNLEQAKALVLLSNKTNRNAIAKVIHLHVDRDDLIQRLSGRRVCEQCGATYHIHTQPSKNSDVCDLCRGALIQRPDDKEDKVVVRLDVYQNQTEPVLNFYKQLGLLVIVDGSRSQELVYEELHKHFAKVA